MRRRTTGLLVLALLAAAPAAGQVSAEERSCLADSVRVRSDPTEALAVLRECARRFPDCAPIQRALATTLAQAEQGCAELGAAARERFQAERPLTSKARRDVRLASNPGIAPDRAALRSATHVRVANALWSEGACWLSVRTADGLKGWAPVDAFERLGLAP